jgi:hypothetical protein
MKFRMYITLAVTLMLVLALSEPAAAQCAMCKATLENSVDAAEAAKGMSLAALVLLIPPVTIFSGLFYAIYRFRDVHGGSSSHGEHDERGCSGVEPRFPDR